LVVFGGSDSPSVYALEPNTVVALPEPLKSGSSLSRASPNPGQRELFVDSWLSDAAPERLELLDIRGRRLAALRLGALGPGAHRVKLADASRMPAGVYVVRLTHGGWAHTTKAVLTR
jgi:hypothetical protein